MPDCRKSIWRKEIKFFYFFRFLVLTMPGFGRAFLPILTRQEGRKADGTSEKRKGI